MAHKVLSNLSHDQVNYKAGDIVELPESAVQPLLDAGVIAPLGDESSDEVEVTDDVVKEETSSEVVDPAQVGDGTGVEGDQVDPLDPAQQQQAQTEAGSSEQQLQDSAGDLSASSSSAPITVPVKVEKLS